MPQGAEQAPELTDAEEDLCSLVKPLRIRVKVEPGHLSEEFNAGDEKETKSATRQAYTPTLCIGKAIT